VVEVLPSLLAWDPPRYGLPPFSDVIASVIPVTPVFYIKGTVVKGFGRGSKVCVSQAGGAARLLSVLQQHRPSCPLSRLQQQTNTRTTQELGIPTANVDADALRSSLAEAVTGVCTS
jgi:riboflavin kinase